MIKAIFFDQDNTLVNTSEISPRIYQEVIGQVAKENGLDSENLYQAWQKVLEEVKNSVDPYKRFFDYSLKLALQRTNSKLAADKISADALAEVISKIADEIKLKSGVAEFFGLDLPYKKILVTEDRQAKSTAKFAKFGLKFDLIVTSADTGIMKPSVKYYELGWQQFGLKPEECLYIGDNWDKDCAIGVETGGVGVLFEKEDPRAKYQIKNMMELKTILDDLL